MGNEKMLLRWFSKRTCFGLVVIALYNCKFAEYDCSFQQRTGLTGLLSSTMFLLAGFLKKGMVTFFILFLPATIIIFNRLKVGVYVQNN